MVEEALGDFGLVLRVEVRHAECCHHVLDIRGLGCPEGSEPFLLQSAESAQRDACDEVIGRDVETESVLAVEYWRRFFAELAACAEEGNLRQCLPFLDLLCGLEVAGIGINDAFDNEDQAIDFQSKLDWDTGKGRLCW